MFVYFNIGKETVNATLFNGLVMCRAIRAYNFKTGHKVVFIYCSSAIILIFTLHKLIY